MENNDLTKEQLALKILALQEKINSLEKTAVANSQTKEELLLSDANLSSILENNSDGIVIVDTDGTVLYTNSAAEKLFGKNKEDFLGYPFGFPISGDKEEDTLVIKNGDTFCEVEMRVVQVHWQKRAAFQLSIRDITRHKQAKAALVNEKDQLRKLLDIFQLPETSEHTLKSFIVDECINITKSKLGFIGIVNEDETLMTAYLNSERAMDGCNIDDKPVAFSVGSGGIWAEAIRKKKPIIINDYQQPDPIKKGLPKGHVPLTRLMSVPLIKKGRAVAIVCLANKSKDYTEAEFLYISLFLEKAWDMLKRKKMEEQLLKSQKMESIGNLAGGIAHDFNNILAAILGFTELSLGEIEKGTRLEEYLLEIFTAGKRAKDLVWQILAFARQSNDELKPILVHTISTEVLKFIRSSIPSTIEIKQNIESESLIMGNDTQVHQVLMNLFTNAAHAMEDKGGILEFSLKDVLVDKGVNREKLDLKPGYYIEIKVSDTGAGIAPEIIDSIFEPYFTTKGIGEGTGMGLAMVNGIIKSYGGKISVDSKPGQGTLFTIFLPVTGKSLRQQPYQSETLPTGKERILFVDDEASIAKMGRRILENLGYTVSTSTSSIEALELFRSKPNHFDLVITDMTMPKMTGAQLAVELMEIRPDIPIILCSGYSKKISNETAPEIGIKAFAEKPVVKADLAKIVRKVLDEAKG